MTKRPAYLKTKSSSYWVLAVLFAALVWLTYSYNYNFPLQSLVDNSELKGRTFQGQAEQITAPLSGVKAYFMSEKDSPLVAVSFVFDYAGTAYEPSGKGGVAGLTAATLKDGVGKQSAESLRDELGNKGINISFGADRDVFSGQMTAPKENMEKAAELLQKVLSSPRFETKYVENARAVALKALSAEKENPGQELSLAFNRMIYDNHAYGRNPLGNQASINKITRDDLQKFVKHNFNRDNLYVGIAGNLNKDEAETLIDKIFAALPEKGKYMELPRPEINWQQPILKIERKSGQNIVAFAAEGTCRKCEDFYPLYIANYLFGGSGLNSKLNQQIREKEGLTYGGYSALLLNDKSHLLTAGFSATPDKFTKAAEMFKKEWAKVRKNGFTQDELQSAKDYLTASYNLRFASTAGIAEMLVYMQKYDLGLDFLQKRNRYVENVDLRQLNQAAAKYFTDSILQAEIGIFEEGEN